MRVVDLSYAISHKMRCRNGLETLAHLRRAPNAKLKTDGFFARSFWMREHYGTHLDAPCTFHCRSGMTVEAIPRRESAVAPPSFSTCAMPPRPIPTTSYRQRGSRYARE